MRLSAYKNEEAIEVLADLLEPASKIMADKDISAAFKAQKPALIIAKTALKKQKQAVIDFVSYLHRQEPGEYEFTIISLIADLLDILNDPEMGQVFSSADTATPSGSATESTEEEDS